MDNPGPMDEAGDAPVSRYRPSDATAPPRLRWGAPPTADGVGTRTRADLTDEQKAMFRDGLQSIVSDAEALLRKAVEAPPAAAPAANDGSAAESGASARSSARMSARARGQVRATLRHARATAAALDGNVLQQAKVNGLAAHDFIRHEPWPVIGGAAALGLLLGVLAGRRR